MTAIPRIILASRSPRRASLLAQMGFRFQVVPVDVAEDSVEVSDPTEHVLSLSKMKAETAVASISGGLVIGADTIVVLGGAILGKPKDARDAKRMLTSLSGKTHEVFTGFTLIQSGGPRFSDVERTSVAFRNLEAWEIDDYVATGGPLDKAGGYGIQDRSGLFVDRIDGCFYNVVGFPLTKFYEGLKRILPADTLRAILNSKNSESMIGNP